jgi:protein phosphatase
MLASSHEKFQQRGHMFVVADGMGAHAAGELASKLATDAVSLTYSKLTDRGPQDALLAAIQDANSQIHSRGNASDDFRGMGTTVSALVLLPQGALVAHVGDSRVYRLRGNRLEQLTFDHSLVWELRAAGHLASEESSSYIPKNIITRSLGPNPEVQVDLEGFFSVRPGDAFLLCSDGLSGQVRDDEIGKIVSVLSPREAIRALIELANLRGGPDNITVIVVRAKAPLASRETIPVGPAPPVPLERKPVHPAYWGAIGGLLAVALLLVAIGRPFAAAICALVAAVTGAIALVTRGGGSEPAIETSRLGKGPYSTADATPDAAFVEQLAQVVRQLEEAAGGADWTIDWKPFRDHEHLAIAARQAGQLVEAVREYCYAMTYMMAELRSQRDRKRPLDAGSMF